MALIHLCDGCARPVENPVKLGVFVVREYCDTCKALAEEFLKAEDQLRIDLVENFKQQRQKMIEASTSAGFKLPDVL